MRIVQFSLDALDKQPISVEVEHSGEKILGAYGVDSQTTILEAGLMTVVLDSQYEIKNKIFHKDLLGKGYTGSLIATSFDISGNFLRAFSKPDFITRELQPDRSLSGYDVSYIDSYIGRFKFEDGRFSVVDPKQSVALKKEQVTSIHECSQDRIIVATRHCIYLFREWKCIRNYELDKHRKNDLKAEAPFESRGQFIELPGFDYKSFPFVLCAGEDSLRILNV